MTEMLQWREVDRFKIYFGTEPPGLRDGLDLGGGKEKIQQIFQRCHHHGPSSFPSQGTTPPICWLSYYGSCVLLWCWKLCHQYFKCQQGHAWWTGFSGASRLRVGRRIWPPTSKKIGHENPMNGSGALFDIAPERKRMLQKDWAGFHFAVHRVTRNWNRWTALTTKTQGLQLTASRALQIPYVQNQTHHPPLKTTGF